LSRRFRFFRGVSVFLKKLLNFLLLRRFRFLKAFTFFWGVSVFFGAFPYFEKLLKLYFVEAFPLFLRRFLFFFEAFPLFFEAFLFFEKTLFVGHHVYGFLGEFIMRTEMRHSTSIKKCCTIFYEKLKWNFNFFLKQKHLNNVWKYLNFMCCLKSL